MPLQGDGDKERRSAFVAGATGYTGREIVRVLCERGVATVAHVRPDSPRLAHWRSYFSELRAIVDTTAWDEAAMTATLRRLRPDCVFVAVGTTRRRMKQAVDEGADPATVGYDAVDYGLTALLLSAVVKARIRPRFIYLSATGVRPHARGAYYKARWRAEEAVRKSGLPYIIARPSFIVGPGRDERRPLETLGARLIDGALTAAGLLGAARLKARYHSTTNTALAEALVRLAFDPSAAGRLFEADELR